VSLVVSDSGPVHYLLLCGAIVRLIFSSTTGTRGVWPAKGGIPTSGTIGVLELAASRGFLDLKDAIQGLLNTNFRIDAEVVRDVLARDAARRDLPGPKT
jgi:hypothetical protein